MRLRRRAAGTVNQDRLLAPYSEWRNWGSSLTHRLAVRGRFVAALTLAIAGCEELREAPPAPGNAEVRLFHASPDGPALDLYVGPMKLLFNNVAYGNATSFQSVDVGTQRLLFTRAGSPHEPLLELPMELEDGEKIDLVAAQEPGRALHVVVLHENSTPPDAGTARVRVLNASPDSLPITLDLGSDGGIELPVLELFQDSGEQGIEIRAGAAQQLGIVSGGRNIGTFTIPPLPGGGNSLLVPTGYVARDPSDLLGLSLLAPGLGLVKQNSGLYFLHLVDFFTDSNPSLDIYGVTGLLISDVKFGDLVRIPVEDGTGASACVHGVTPRFCFEISAAGVEPGHEYLVLVRHKVDSYFTHLFADTFDSNQADPQLRFINAAYLPGVDVGVIDAGQFEVFAGYAQLGYFASVSGIEVLPPGSSTLGFRLIDSSTLYRFEEVLSPGSHSFAIIGPLRSGPEVFLIDTATQPWNRTVLSPLP
jgi:Domain of unknown function (DUF4397)